MRFESAHIIVPTEALREDHPARRMLSKVALVALVAIAIAGLARAFV